VSELSCQDIIEIVTEYLEGAMSTEERQRFEDHLSSCPGCVTYVEQIRRTIDLVGKAPHEEDLPPALREGLVAQFRSWQGGGATAGEDRP
jgi:anti-sigma factor (TIGR02949 family)